MYEYNISFFLSNNFSYLKAESEQRPTTGVTFAIAIANLLIFLRDKYVELELGFHLLIYLLTKNLKIISVETWAGPTPLDS